MIDPDSILTDFDFSFASDDDELGIDEDEEAQLNCSRMPDGHCDQAGSEYCEFECPHR